MRYLWDYIKHFYLAIVIIAASLAGYSAISGQNVVQKFEEQYDYKITAYNFKPSREYWNEDTKTVVTDSGDIQLIHGETTDGFVFSDESGRSRNLILFYKFSAKKDDVRPYTLIKDNFIFYQDGRELSDGGISDENDSKIYQDVMNSGVSFYKKGDTVLAARAITYQPNGGPLSVVVNGTEYLITDLIKVYSDPVFNKPEFSVEGIDS